VGTLVGRGPALTAARRVLDDVYAGAGQVLLVAGEPGIGKTALLAAIAREAADRRARVLRGICWAGAAPPWWRGPRCCGPRTCAPASWARRPPW
jgi:hypothetical protein